MSFSFANPGILALLLVVPLLLPLAFVRYRRNREKAALFAAAAPSGERGALLKELRFRMIISELLFLLFLAFLVIALAGPRWGLRKVNDYRRGVDVVLAFDLSRSMNVEDCAAGGHEAVSRLERGRRIALDLAPSLGDVRVGVAIGKGAGVLAVPLTYDDETVASFLHALDGAIVTGGGTNLESLVDAALGAFQDSIPSRRLIVLFSDGEGLSGAFQAAVDRAGKAAVAIVSVGLGSREGGPVPVPVTAAAPDGFLLGADGNPVISARRDDLLRVGAERSGGIYVDCALPDASRVLGDYVASISSDSRLSGQRWEPNPRFGLFVFAALLCLLAARLAGYKRGKNEKRKGKKATPPAFLLPFSFLLFPFFFSSCDGIQGKLLIMEANFLATRGYYNEAIAAYLRAREYADAAPYAEYGLASAFFALEESDSALDRYLEAENALGQGGGEHNELRYRINFNRGIIYFERGEYIEAAAAFREALKADPSRVEAKRNLELSLLTDTWRIPPAPVHSPEGGENPQGDTLSQVLFEYLRAKEQEQWRSREWVGEGDPSGLDY